MTYTITLIGAVGGTSAYTEQDITQLLSVEQIKLLHGDTFTGRPGTQIYINTDTVLKIRSEIRLDAHSAKRWAIQALEKEQRYQIYHPHKTWFVAENTTQALIGSICPRLQPLHELLTHTTVDSATYLNYLQQLFSHYFRLAKTLNVRLDEGLSNFGIETAGKLYYLDDDIYNWDRFISCAHTLGTYFRSLSWLTADIAEQFGQIIHELILTHFNDAQYLTVLEEQLKDVFIPAKPQRLLLEQFINSLVHQKTPRHIVDFTKNRYLALLGDVHANLPALTVALDFLKQEGIQQGLILGDIVGYGPHPSQCIERVQNSGLVVLKGNHDHGLATDNFSKGFSKSAAWVLEWSLSRVSAAQKTWLVNLPPVLHNEHWLALHGAPIDPTFFNAYVYEMTYHDNLDVLQNKKIAVCFHGHTHLPGVYGRKGVYDEHYISDVVELKQFSHALVCPGSVGQPRNRQSGVQFAIYDQETRAVHFYNLAYDMEATIHDMEKEGFPETTINIIRGKW